MCLRLRPRAAVLPPRLRLPVRPLGLRLLARVPATVLGLPGLVRGSSLIVAVMCVGMMKAVSVPRKARMRRNIVRALQDDKA